MNLQVTHAVAPYLVLAELGAALFGSSAASAEERITLEVIGAVRMAGPAVIHRDDGAPRQTEARQTPQVALDRAEAAEGFQRH